MTAEPRTADRCTCPDHMRDHYSDWHARYRAGRSEALPVPALDALRTALTGIIEFAETLDEAIEIARAASRELPR